MISGMENRMRHELQRISNSVRFRCCVCDRPASRSEQLRRSTEDRRQPAEKRGGGNIMVLNLIKVSDVPAIGQHKGIFTDIRTASGKDAEGNELNHLIVTVELEATDSAGKQYQLEKKYNLLNRGLATFRNDYKSWSGKKVSDKDL